MAQQVGNPLALLDLPSGADCAVIGRSGYARDLESTGWRYALAGNLAGVCVHMSVCPNARNSLRLRAGRCPRSGGAADYLSAETVLACHQERAQVVVVLEYG